MFSTSRMTKDHHERSVRKRKIAGNKCLPETNKVLSKYYVGCTLATEHFRKQMSNYCVCSLPMTACGAQQPIAVRPLRRHLAGEWGHAPVSVNVHGLGWGMELDVGQQQLLHDPVDEIDASSRMLFKIAKLAPSKMHVLERPAAVGGKISDTSIACGICSANRCVGCINGSSIGRL